MASLDAPTIATTAVKCRELAAKFPELITEVIGDADRSFNGVSAPDQAKEGTAVFLANPKAFAAGIKSAAQVVVVHPKMRDRALSEVQDQKTIIICSQVEFAMAKVINEYFLRTPYTNRSLIGIHPTAVIAPNAKIGDGCRIGPCAVIGANVRLGSQVAIGAHAVIEDDTEIGDKTVIHPLVYIGHSTSIGQNCEIMPQTVIGKEGFGYGRDAKGQSHRTPHLGRVVIEDHVDIGSSCTIDRGTFGDTRIGRGTKLDNLIHLGHNCKIGSNCLVTAGFTMAGSSQIGSNFVAGGRSNVTGHISVTDNVQIAGLSAITHSLTEPGQYGGDPIMPLQTHLKVKSSLDKLPEMRKQISRILKHLGLK